MNFKILALTLLVATALARTYPMYKQCDSRWGNEILGTSSNTICKSGCAVSSVAMALSGIGRNYNPSTLNTWLKGNKGFVSGDSLVWGSVSPLGLSFQGKISNDQIASNLAANKVVIINVRNGGHWVLATAMSGTTISVNDPGFSNTSYSLSQVKAGNSVLYGVSGGFLGMMIDELEIAFNVNGRRDKMMEANGAIAEQ